MDDALWSDFRQFVEGENVSYQTEAEREVAVLADEIREAGYSGAEGALDDLRQAIEREKAADFDRHADRLRAHLGREILSRYVGQRAQTVAALEEDAVLEAARRVLLDAGAYNQTLGR